MIRTVISLASLFLTVQAGLAADNGPEIRMVDRKLSVEARAIPLSQLLRMFDVATGLNSTAPKEMSAKPISVQFSDLDLGLAVRKMFEGQKIDYIFVEEENHSCNATEAC